MLHTRKAIIKQLQISKYITSTLVKDLKKLINNNIEKEYFDGEHVLKMNNQCYLMYFDKLFQKQTPHYHIGNPLNCHDLYSNGGGERNLYGITDTGIGIKTPSQNIIIKPTSICHIHFPGSPPTIHQFYGINQTGEGTALISIHNNKKQYFRNNNMETYTVFTQLN